MTRVQHARSQPASRPGLNLDQTRAGHHQKKKPYKIVLEAVTQEKKKLHSILTYASNAPTGFGFIPAGHPEFTEWCKEQCRQRNLDVHIVSAKPKNKMHADPEKLSHHVHRVGHHFPLEIIRLACSKFGYTYDDASGLKKSRSSDRINWIAQSMEDYGSRQALHGRPTTETETKEYIHGAVREMFPKIPEADLSSIVNHAFEEGTNRVGNAKELSLARRVQLAVVAHIRHMYTDYDKLLKTGGWMEARSKVEHVSLAKLKEWRDETDTDSNELEDTFREVIVLDDDDDASSDGEMLSTPDEREQSMEIVSSRATARDLQPERSLDFPRVDMRDMRRAPRRTIVAQRYPPPPPLESASGSSHSRPDAKMFHSSNAVLQNVSRPPPPMENPLPTAHARSVDPYVQSVDSRGWTDPSIRTRPRATRPDLHAAPLIRDIDGRLYKLQPVEQESLQPRAHFQPHLRTPPRHRPEEPYSQYPPPPAAYSRPSQSRRTSEQDLVLPSVEPDLVDLTSPRHFPDDPRPVYHGPADFASMRSPKRKAQPFPLDNRDPYNENIEKRMRPLHHGNARDREPLAAMGSVRYRESHPQVQSSQPLIDLTAGPYRPLVAGERREFSLAHSRPINHFDGHSYVSASSRPPPMREVRSAYLETPGNESPYAYMSESGTHERYGRPGYDFAPVERERVRPRLEAESPRHTRNGLSYREWCGR